MDAISWQLLIEGAWTTLWISAIAIAFGVVIGLLIALAGFLVNWYYRAAQDRRDQIEHEARLRREEDACAHDK